jgi:flagellar basal-body rod modification protein FlgD
MTVAAITAPSAAVGATATPSTTTAGTQEMDSDMFMTLLVAQLENQDPSSPMDTNAMITQTTQLATMEKLTSMEELSTESFSLQMRNVAADLIGQTVTYTDADGAAASGVATAVSYAAGVPTVTVGDTDIALDSITGVQQ